MAQMVLALRGGTTGISDIGFVGPWMLSEITVRFSTDNISDTCFQVFIIRRAGISEVSLASTHSMFISHQTIMSWMVSDSMSHMLTQSFTSAGIWLLPGDTLQFDYSMDSGINAWAIDVEGWAVQ